MEITTRKKNHERTKEKKKQNENTVQVSTRKQTWRPTLLLRTCAGGCVAPASRAAAKNAPVDCTKSFRITGKGKLHTPFYLLNLKTRIRKSHCSSQTAKYYNMPSDKYENAFRLNKMNIFWC